MSAAVPNPAHPQMIVEIQVVLASGNIQEGSYKFFGFWFCFEDGYPSITRC